MLNQMRRSASGFVTKILLGLLVVSFVVWGITDFLTPGGAGTSVLTAGDTRVSVSQYQTAYRQGVDQMAQRLQRRPTPQEAEALGVDQSVLSQLAAGALLDEQASQAGVGVSDAGLIALIQQEPAFQGGNGAFSRDVMRAVLRNAGLSEQAYLEDLAGSARRTQVVGAISDGIAAPDAFVQAFGGYRGERRTVSYVTLAPEAADTIADPSADELDDFFTENRESYRAPEYRTFRYVLLSPEALAANATVADGDIQAYYDANRAQFATPERRQVRQAVFADRAAADAAAAAIAGGQTLDAAAEAAGASVVDLGLVPRTAVPSPALADAAFAAEPGATTPVVDGPFGPVILQVAGVEPETARPLDEVRDQIRRTLATNSANETVATGYNAMLEATQSGATLSEAAEQATLPVSTATAVDRTGHDMAGAEVPDLAGQPGVLEAAFAADQGAPVEPVSVGANGYVFVEVDEVTEARDQELAEVEARVIQTWKEDEAQRLLEERAAAIADRVRRGEALADVAAAEGLQVQLAPAITRQSGVSAIGQAATRAAFSGAVGTVASSPALESGRAAVLRVDEISQPADADAEVPETARSGFDAALREDMFQSYISRLQSQIPVSYDVNAINQAKSGVR